MVEAAAAATAAGGAQVVGLAKMVMQAGLRELTQALARRPHCRPRQMPHHLA